MSQKQLPAGKKGATTPKWASTSHREPIGTSSLRISCAIVILIACLVAAYLVIGFTSSASGVMGSLCPPNLFSWLPSLSLGGPTPPPIVTVWPPVITYVGRMERLQTATYHIEAVISEEQRSGPFGLLSDRMLFVAVGKVTAGVDMGLMTPDDIDIDPVTNEVHIIMPQAQLFDCFLDVDSSYVYDRDSGVLGLDLGVGYSEQLETQVRRLARDRIRETALEDGILETAQEEAIRFVTELIRGMGYDDVKVEVSTETPPLPRNDTCYSDEPTPTPTRTGGQ